MKTLIDLPIGAPLPALPPTVPTRRYTLAKPIARFILWILGWRLEGGFPDAPRQVLIGWPHTSNWDGVIGLAGAAVCGIDVRIYAKKALFRFPIGWLMREFGGIPVERGQPGGLIGAAVSRFAEAEAAGESFVLAIAPEGTRSGVDGWKRGFYRIAHKADVPVSLLGFDYERKRLVVFGGVMLTGNVEADLARIERVLAPSRGKHHELATPATAGLLPASTPRAPDSASGD